ncbi:hypothetical protein RND81_10G120200 [Saponaria officinalis]|uniref:RING-CH-type domain-containing protein n=2 Tax=Saponaria officinalis TaxID=3572 RepID=A0AAW1I142_SAPOF
MDVGGVPKILALCRICHDEDEPAKMESPCSCCGSLKYAHRRCIQMWCNQKGNIICEICLQEFKSGYSAPPRRSPFAIIPVRLREPWELLRSEQYIHPPVYAAEHNFFDQNFDDYVAPTASIICCRIIASIFVVLLVLRHTLPIILNSAGEYSFMLYTLLMLRSIGILVPLFVMLKACSIIRRHRSHRQTRSDFNFTSDEENDIMPPQLPSHFIHIQ